jgi:hypothetical protein
VKCEASQTAAARHRSSPADRGGSALQNLGETTRIEARPAVLLVRQLARRAEQFEPQCERILPARVRDLVDEALDDEGVGGVRRRAPAAARHPRIDSEPFIAQVRDAAGREIVGIDSGITARRAISGRR